MNYLAEINAFHRLMRRQPLSEAAQLLWFKLMDFDNHLFWQTPFQIDNDRLAGLLGSSENKAKAARDQLIQAGLLEFTQGVKRKPSSYRLIPPSLQEGPPMPAKPEGIEEYDEDADDITRFHGYTAALGLELKQITREIIGRYWPEHEPDENDERRVFLIIKEQREEDGVTVMTFPTEKKALLAHAFEQSSMASKHTWQYIFGCYRIFHRKGITTIDDALENEARRAEAKGW